MGRHNGRQNKLVVLRAHGDHYGVAEYTTRYWSATKDGWHFWVRDFGLGDLQPVGFEQARG